MRFRFFLFISFIFFTINSSANDIVELTPEEIQVIVEFQDQFNDIVNDTTATRIVKFKRGKAIVFTLLTGLFGGHRIYFGTHHRTPILYSITFGGLGILPLIDLVHIIFTKDLSRYEHKSQVIMWGK